MITASPALLLVQHYVRLHESTMYTTYVGWREVLFVGYKKPHVTKFTATSAIHMNKAHHVHKRSKISAAATMAAVKSEICVN